MKHLLSPLALAFALLPLACDEEDDDMDSGGDTANDDGGNDESAGPADDGADGADDAPATSMSMETCDSSHACVNDVCECTTPGKEEQPCTDDVACEDECEVCM
jgi:hypothetical protein